MSKSYAPEVQTDNSGKWYGNALRFATETEAQKQVRDLSWRWLLVRDTRVVPSDDPPNYRWDGDIGLVALQPTEVINGANSSAGNGAASSAM